MVDYRIVKYCRMCKVRFIVSKGESKKNYCDKCITKMNKERKEDLE